MKVIKRDDSEQDFCLDKIYNAVRAANNSVAKEDKMDEASIEKVIATVRKKLEGFNSIKVEDIQDLVEQSLVRHNKYVVGKSYILYREEKRKKKKRSLEQEKILSLINGTSDLRGDNANKHIDDNGAISDYMAGIMSKSLSELELPKDILQFHKSGKGHWHDSDYFDRPMHNCDVLNAEDMFNHNFMMQSTLIEPDDETPFRTACNLLSQINLIVSGRQYGGQTVTWAHLIPFVQKSRDILTRKLMKHYCEEEKIIKVIRKLLHFVGVNTGCYNMKAFRAEVERQLRDEIYEGVKTYQYQILSHSSSNGQTPFVSNNLCLREAETQEELDDFAMIIEEIFKRRIKGVKNANGQYITPLFPKLLYWTCDGLNVEEGDKYFYLTELAAKCIAERMQPDIVSERETRRVKQGQIIPSMGCRSLLSPIWEEHEYPVDTEFYYTHGDANGNYPYGTFVKKRSFEKLFDGKYDKGVWAINFRGNTGWLIEKTQTTVRILEPKVYGRWNNGVVSINLPHVALSSLSEDMISEMQKGNFDVYSDYDINKFYETLDERLAIVRKALKIRYEMASKIKGKNSEILWCHGALARMGKEDTVGDLMKKYPQRASISVGYAGLFETCMALTGKSNTTEEGRKLSKEILTYMLNKCTEWQKEDGINYAIYGTPEESLTYKFAMANRKDFGVIPHITDKDYVVNSYHVDPREHIDAFTKLQIEGEYLALSSGGAVSYIETGDLTNNHKALINVIKWMHSNIVYAEVNRKIGVCYDCGYVGDIPLTKSTDGNFTFTCPHCGNQDDNHMEVTARLCGYLGTVNAGNTNKGRLDDIYNRTEHLDCFENNVLE